MILMIDNYDSFVFNLVRYFEELDEEVIVYRNDEISIDQIKELKIDAIVLSPGPKSPNDAGVCLNVIEEFKDKLPILGICLGHQCIGHFFGANIIRGDEPVHGKTSKVVHNEKYLFSELKNPLRVTRYHSLIIDNKTVPDILDITCETEDGIIMGIRHKELQIYGVQFHPEAEMTEDGHNLLRNFIEMIKLQKEKV